MQLGFVAFFQLLAKVHKLLPQTKTQLHWATSLSLTQRSHFPSDLHMCSTLSMAVYSFVLFTKYIFTKYIQQYWFNRPIRRKYGSAAMQEIGLTNLVAARRKRDWKEVTELHRTRHSALHWWCRYGVLQQCCKSTMVFQRLSSILKRV